MGIVSWCINYQFKDTYFFVLKLYDEDAGLYKGDVGLYAGDMGLYEGEVGLYAGLVGEYLRNKTSKSI